MRARLFVFLLALASAASADSPPTPAPATLTANELAQGFSDRVVLAKPRPQYRNTADAAETRERVRVRRKFARFGDVRVIELDGTETVAAAIARLQATGRYEFVEPSHLQKPYAIPNDPGFLTQWQFNNTGQNLGGGAGTPGADIKAPAAWDVINDASSVIVAIVDTGARLIHPEIAPNLWRNPAPTFGDIHGARFTSGTGVPTNGDPTDDDGHGTRMAGFIGGAGNNNLLFMGVAWKVQIMPLKQGFDAAGNFLVADTVACFDYAITHGAKIINCSFGNTTFSQTFYAALKAARDAGVIVVCGSGNNGVNSDVTPFYPANYALDNIVTVGMTSNTDAVSSRSNFGANVDLLAPGVEIVALNWANDTGFTVVTGTSPATAFVSGSLALLKARFPGDTYRQLINRLLRATDRKPAFVGKAQSGGRLNLFNAVTSTSNRPMNDDFAARAIVSGALATIRSNNVGATTETGESALAGAPAAATLWWEWTAPATAPVTLDTAGSDYDTVLAVYTGTTLGALTGIAANDDAAGRTTSRVTFAAQAGTTYQFAVGSKGAATGLTLISLTPAQPNDILAATPAIARQPVSQNITSGNTVVFSAAATGAPNPTYQWRRNGVNLAGQTNATLVVVGAGPLAAGAYTAVVTNSSGSVISTAATLNVLTNVNDSGRLSNLSILTPLAPGETLTMGTVLGGGGTVGAKPLLARAAGPSLSQLGVTAFLPDPTMSLVNTSGSPAVTVATNNDWNGTGALNAAFASVGAFAYSGPASKDAAIFHQNLLPGNYTVEVSDAGTGAGSVIAELYDATPAGAFTGATPRLVNVSALKEIAAGASLTAGFYVGGTMSKTVLIRAVGPTLGLPPFNIQTAMPDPQLTLFNGSQATIASNNDWGGDQQIVNTAGRVGAFAVTNAGSKDAMLLVTLAPGSYTAEVTAVSGTAGGLAIVEVYEVP